MKNNLPPWLIVSILIGFFSWIVWSQFVEAPLVRARTRIQQELAEVKELREAQLRVHRLRENLRAMQGQFAPTTDTEWLVNRLASRVQEAGLRMESIDPHAPVTVQDFQQLSVTVQLSASYHQIGKLLSQLEGSDELIWVQDLDIDKAPARSSWGADPTRLGSSTLPRVRLTLAALYVPEEIGGKR